MVKLSEFLGEILKDISSARTYADYSAAAISEEYFADPFIKSLPIPHYIIDEAEVNVPVMVVGLNTQTEEFAEIKNRLQEVLTESLHKVLFESFKWNYINERIKRQKSKNEMEHNTIDYKKFDFTGKKIAKVFDDGIDEICKTVMLKFSQNLELYNYKVLKLLEITETFKKELGYALKAMIEKFKSNQTYVKNDYNPFLTDDSVINTINYTTSIIFFNFKKIMQSDAGVLIDINTSIMNEYAQNDCLMHIKLKIKEQDLTLLVEEQNKKEKRYLSLA